ncbi:MAG: hypothetical protein SF123_14485 [Chloroflexota bacterium]|nr:hypothetical protein [Chloroflexota bacterium]
MIRFRLPIAFLALIAALSLQNDRTLAQETEATPVNTAGFLVTNQGYREFNGFSVPTTAEVAFQTASISTQSESALTYLVDVEVDRSNNNLYGLFSESGVSNPFETPTQLQRISLTSGESEIIFEQAGAIDTALSPSSDEAAITYYQHGVSGAELATCILSFSDSVCTPLNVRIAFGAQWISSNSLLLSSQYPNSLIVANTRDGSIRSLSGLDSWLISAVAIVPSSNTLLVTGSRITTEEGFHPDQVLTYDLSTETASLHSYQPSSLDYIQSSLLEVTPDGRYFVVGNTQKVSVVEMDTGRILGELDGITHVSWFSNSQHLLAVEVVGLGNVSIIRFDLATATTTTLLSNQTEVPLPIAP